MLWSERWTKSSSTNILLFFIKHCCGLNEKGFKIFLLYGIYFKTIIFFQRGRPLNKTNYVWDYCDFLDWAVHQYILSLLPNFIEVNFWLFYNFTKAYLKCIVYSFSYLTVPLFWGIDQLLMKRSSIWSRFILYFDNYWTKQYLIGW